MSDLGRATAWTPHPFDCTHGYKLETCSTLSENPSIWKWCPCSHLDRCGNLWMSLMWKKRDSILWSASSGSPSMWHRSNVLLCFLYVTQRCGPIPLVAAPWNPMVLPLETPWCCASKPLRRPSKPHGAVPRNPRCAAPQNPWGQILRPKFSSFGGF